MRLQRVPSRGKLISALNCDPENELMNPSGNRVISIFSGQKPWTRIISTKSHSFLHFSRAIDIVGSL